MTTIQWDSELMTNYAEAVNVPAGKKLGACVDEIGKQAAVFALSNHEIPKLQLIRINKDGRRVLIDLARLLNVPSGSVIQTFGVQQSDDLTVFLSFSVKVDDRQSNLWIVKPFKLLAELTLLALPVRTVGTVHDIQFGPYGVDGSGYPALYLLHQPLNRTAKNSDLAQIRVNLRSNNWEARKELTLPQNVQKIIDIAPIFSGFFGHGLIYLCEQNSNRSLYGVLVRPGEEIGDRGSATLLQLPCPQDATSIATFTDFNDSEQRSSLLIGCGAGIRLIAADEITSEDGVSHILINNDDSLSGARDLQISQTQQSLSVFAINAKEELVFLTTTLDDVRNARAAPILPAGSVSAFAAVASSAQSRVHHSIVCNDAIGNLTLLQQALDTGIWRHQPFYVESGGELVPFESYTVTLTARDSKKNPITGGKVQLQAPSTLPVIINGSSTLLTPTGAWYALDIAGEIGLIIPTKTITSQPIAVKGLKDSAKKNIEFSGITIDPAARVVSRMSSFSDPKGLLDAKTQEGEPLWEKNDRPSDKDLQTAARSFSAIQDAYKTLPKNGSTVSSNTPTTAISKVNAPRTGNIFMDGFLWLKHKAEQATEWLVRQAGNVWEFVCTIAGKPVNFVLDCVEKITEAASWIWDKLKIGWEKLCKCIGYLFNWDHILETKDTVVGFLNASLDMAANRAEGFNLKIDGLFSNIQETVKHATGATGGTGFRNFIKSKNHTEDKELGELRDSAPSKWAGERMKNGNATQTAGTKNPTPGNTTEAELVSIWSDRVMPILKDFDQLVQVLAKDIAALFKEDKGLSQDALLSRLGGNLLINILEIVKKLLQAVVSVVAKVVLIVKDLGNFKLSGGFLNTFYRWISKGKDLTLFEAAALLIAIPSTLIIKLVTGAKPPTFQKLDANFVESVVSANLGEEVLSTSLVKPASKQTMKDVATIVLGCGCGAALIGVFQKNVKLAYKTATGGVAIGVGAMTPSAIVELFGMAIDAFSLFKDLFVEPLDKDTPGAAFIEIARAVKMFRLASHGLYLVATKLGLDNRATEQVDLCIKLITALINFSLYSAVYARQLDATSWKGREEDILVTATVDNFLETLSNIGYFTAASLRDSIPEAAVVGMLCFEVAAWGGVATKGLSFRSEWKRL